MFAPSTTTHSKHTSSQRSVHSSSRSARLHKNQDLVHKIAKRVYPTCKSYIEFDELLAWGNTGLLEAIDRYDPNYQSGGRRAAFSTFAFYRVRGAMLDGISREAPMSRSVYRRFVDEFGEAPKVKINSRHIEDHSISSIPSPDALLQSKEEFEVLRNAIESLSTKERCVIMAHYFEDKTLKAAGGELGISKSWTSRVHDKALSSLRQRLVEAAPTIH